MKKTISILLSLIMLLSVFTIIPVVSAGALDGVGYLDENGEEQTANGVTAITSGTTTLNAGWYAVTADTEINSRITCTGDVYLILCNDTTLTAHKGITVSGDDNSLTIYQQAEAVNAETGKLIIDQVDRDNAGIGGSNNGSGNNITINGGTVTVTGGYHGAGIGGGYKGSGNNITVNGGTVTVTGSFAGAGIGGGSGSYGNNITINGGTVSATGGQYGAGIGGGYGSYGKNITINGGIVTATGGSCGAGIGGGFFGSGEDITINGGAVTATGVENGAGIGGGYQGGGGGISLSWTNVTDNITVNSYSGTVSLGKPFHDGASVFDAGTVFEAGVVSDKSKLANKTLRPYYDLSALDSVSYIDENGDPKTAGAATIVTGDMTAFSSRWTSGWYAVNSDITNNNRITCNGDINLILCDGAKLTVNSGIAVNEGSSITIYGQSGGTGELKIDGTALTHDASLGSDSETNSGTITINGGKIIATCGRRGAAIGSGYSAECSVIINGGHIQASGSNLAAGAVIGSGYQGSGTVTINGGIVSATYADYGAAIGGGSEGSGTVTINGGTVNAIDADYGAAIGGGSKGSYAVVINGGNVSAFTSGEGEGIGDGANGTGGTISLSWTDINDSIFTSCCYLKKDSLKKTFHDGASAYEVGTIYKAGAESYEGGIYYKTLRPYYPIFAGHSISLKGDIGMNYFLDETTQGAQLHCEWYNKTFDHTVTEADYDAASGYYKVQVNVAVAEMNCPVTATLTNADGDSITDVYSVRDYADVILDSESDFSNGYVAANGAEKYGVLVDLIKKTLDYGAKAQTRFGVTDYELANTGVDYTMELITANHIKTKKTDMTKDLDKAGLNYVGTSIVFLSQTTLRHYYVISDARLFALAKETANFTFVDKGQLICFEQKDISAAQLDVAQIFRLGDTTYNYSVLDYCKLVLADESKSQADRELAMATYWYNDAAKAYFYGSDEYEDDMV